MLSFIVEKECLCKYTFNHLQILSRIFIVNRYTICLLSIVPLFIFFGTFFEKDFTQNFFLLFVGVVILHIVVGGLVEDEVVVVVAVWVFVSDTSCLHHTVGLDLDTLLTY